MRGCQLEVEHLVSLAGCGWNALQAVRETLRCTISPSLQLLRRLQRSAVLEPNRARAVQLHVS